MIPSHTNMLRITPQQIYKDLSGYSFSDVETIIIKNILNDAGIKEVKNRTIREILNRKVNIGVSFWFRTNKIVPNLELLEKIYELNVTGEDRKVNGSYYTPTDIVSYIIENTVDNLGSICDPACGSGAFLVESTKLLRRRFALSYEKIFRDFLFGVDILASSVERTKIILSLLAILDREDKNFHFNIYTGDSLVFDWGTNKNSQGFDYVVGNPPYVRTKNLRVEIRENIKKWRTANYGNTDLYIPFFEIATKITKENGRIGFITPSTYLTSLNARRLREFLVFNKLVKRIVDFNGWQIFEGATTYTCITILDKKGSEYLEFSLVNNQEKLQALNTLKFDKIELNLLGTEEWRLLTKGDAEKIFKIEGVGSPLFKYVNKFVTGLATLNNDLFLVTDTDNNLLQKEYKGNIFLIERSITKKVIKPNRIKDRNALAKNRERIIYPYIYGDNGKVKIMPEPLLRDSFPRAYEYLCAVREELKLRDKGKKKYEAWYAYGRTQGLNNFGKKIILPMMGNKPSFITVEEEDTLIYCGYAIFPKSKEDFALLEKILNSSLMWFYLEKTSKNYSGGFKSFAKNYVKKFSIPELDTKQKTLLLSFTTLEKTNEYLYELYGLENNQIIRSQ